jgi:hypothetical protein
MTNLELLQLERLLTKYHIETEGPLGLSNIRPCLFMVREKLALIGGGYSKPEKEFKLAGDMANQFNESFDEDEFWGYDGQEEGGL